MSSPFPDQIPYFDAQHVGDAPGRLEAHLVPSSAALDRTHLPAGERGEHLDVPERETGALAQVLDPSGDGPGKVRDAGSLVRGHCGHAGNCQPHPQPARGISAHG